MMKVVVDTNLWISFLLHGKVYPQIRNYAPNMIQKRK